MPPEIGDIAVGLKHAGNPVINFRLFHRCPPWLVSIRKIYHSHCITRRLKVAIENCRLSGSFKIRVPCNYSAKVEKVGYARRSDRSQLVGVANERVRCSFQITKLFFLPRKTRKTRKKERDAYRGKFVVTFRIEAGSRLCC